MVTKNSPAALRAGVNTKEALIEFETKPEINRDLIVQPVPELVILWSKC